MRTLLKKVLSDVGLTYIVKDNVIQVTTPEIAKQTLTTRTYYMGDLMTLTDVRVPAYARQAEAMRTIQDVIGVIVGTVEPNKDWCGEWRPRSHRLRAAHHDADRDANG